jgi:hypothetical protein
VAATIANRAQDSISGSTVPSALFLQPNMIDWTKKVRWTNAPLYKLIGRGKAPSVPAVKLEWGFSYPDSVIDQLNGAVTDTGAAVVTLDDASKVQIGSLLLCESEVMRVLTLNETTNVVGVDRGYGGTTAATHVDNMSVLIMAPAIAENQETPLSPYTQGEADYNYFQQSEWSVQLSHRAEVIPTRESFSLKVNNRLEADLRKKMEDTIPEMMEWNLLFGPRAIGTASAASTMGGILNTSSYVTTVNTSISGALTYGTLLDNMSDLHDLVGPRAGKTWMAHPLVCEIISSFFEPLRQAGPSDTKVKTYWTEIDTGWYGTIKLFPNNKFVATAANGTTPLARILVFNEEDLDVVPLSGDSGFSMEPVDVSGAWAKRIAIRGDHTLAAKNPDTRMLLGGFSVTRSDYAALT